MTTPSPLQQLEDSVRASAEGSSIALDSADGRRQIRDLIDAELAGWSQGGSTGAVPDQTALAERALRNLVGYGPLGPLLDDPDVWEIMVNAPDRIFAKRHLAASGYHSEVFHDDEHVLRTLTRILDDAPGSARRLDPSAGLQDAQLASGARLHIVHRELGHGGHVLVNIRKFSPVSFDDLPALRGTGMLDQRAVDLLAAAVGRRCSILVAGPPGSGKTTLLSCLLGSLDPDLRVVTAEEVFEADIPLANVAAMQTRPERADCPEIDLRRLVSGFLRMAPDVAVVGEVRDREALPFVLALSSGVTGYSTIHAGSAAQALARVRLLCQLDGARAAADPGALGQLVAETVDLVVVCRRTAHGPRLVEIAAVEDAASNRASMPFTLTPLAVRTRPSDGLSWSDTVSPRLDRHGVPHRPGSGSAGRNAA
ncbi:MAG: ATPase, T2SS/T4P/T4SS family [Actinomycetota bacterium]